MANLRANENWDLPEFPDFLWDHVKVALLMDIRTELRAIREHTAPLVCSNARHIPALLRRIARHTDRTRKPRKRKKVR
jgi:hypothetical protein